MEASDTDKVGISSRQSSADSLVRVNPCERTQEVSKNVFNGEVDVHHGLEINDATNEVRSNELGNYGSEEEVNGETHSSTVAVEHVNIEDTEDTQLGNRNVYHGEVDVHHILEINAEDNQPGPAFPYSTEIPAVHPLKTPVLSDELLQQFNVSQEAYRILTEPSNQETYSSESAPLINKSEPKRGFITKEYFVLVSLVMAALIFAIVLTIIYGHVKANEDLPINFAHIYRSRSKWFASPPKYYIPVFTYLPPKFVVISHTETKDCDLTNICNREVRDIQAAQMAATYDDIAYSFLVAGDGMIYEGRGWYQRSATVPSMGCSSLAVAFVGNFTTDLPPKKQIDALKILLDTSEDIGKLAKGYKIFMEREIVQGSDSPGLNLTKYLQKWPHWNPFSHEDMICD
ncbi:hypothetical protein O3M35_002448 [Rhynocoris fuscipes]|uniref:Uncharacterized protein n=1 Tax=Rhynocoris fuscipes TaxID=488301 RepID=A0AAW1CLX1_9HEMI